VVLDAAVGRLLGRDRIGHWHWDDSVTVKLTAHPDGQHVGVCLANHECAGVYWARTGADGEPLTWVRWGSDLDEILDVHPGGEVKPWDRETPQPPALDPSGSIMNIMSSSVRGTG
jgi:hypothetical protein